MANLVGPLLGLGASYAGRALLRGIMSSRKRKATSALVRMGKRGARANKYFAIKGGSIGRALRLGASAPEMKSVDSTSSFGSDNAYNNNLSTHLVCSVGVGANSWQRVGRKLCMKSLQGRVRIVVDGTWAGGSICWALVLDRQPQATLPTFQDIFQSRNNAGTAVAAIDSPINLDNRERFRILRHKVWYLTPSSLLANPTGIVSDQDDNGRQDFYIKMSEDVLYKGDGGTIADFASGAVYLVCYNNSKTAASGAVTCNFCVRMRYTD